MKYFDPIYRRIQYRANFRIPLITILITSLNLSCHQTKIVLERVPDLPEYILDNINFGKDIKSIYEKDFVLITGKVDTTLEFPPVRIAVIVISKNKIFLTLQKTQLKNDETNEKYQGEGYNLHLRYKEKQQNHSPIYYGYLVIKYGTSKC